MKLLASLIVAAALSVAIWVPFEGRTGWERLRAGWSGTSAMKTAPRPGARPAPARATATRQPEKGLPAAPAPRKSPVREPALPPEAARGAPQPQTQRPRTLAARSPAAGRAGIARGAPPEAIAPSDRAALEILIGRSKQ